MEASECSACDKKSSYTVNLRRSSTNIEQFMACQYHFNLAQSKLMVFLKHVRKKKKID